MDDRASSRKDALIIIAPTGSVPEVQNMVAASLPEGSICTGSVWRDPEGKTVEVLDYKSEMPVYRAGYDLEVCGSGAPLSPEDITNTKRWRGGK